MRNNKGRVGSKAKQSDPTPQVAPQQAKQDDTLSFVSPTTFVTLPSQGRHYPEDHPLYMKDSVEIKQMTAKQEDILTSKALIKKGIVIDRLIESILTDPGVNVNDLLVVDKNAIMIAARIDAYGPDYEVDVSCPSCSAASKHSFDLDECLEEGTEKVLETTMPDNVTRTESGTYLISLSTGLEVEVKLMTSKDEMKVVKTMNQASKANVSVGQSTLQLRTIIVSLAGYDDRATINKSVDVMPMRLVREIRKAYKGLSPSLELKSSFSCPSCSAESEVEVPLTAEFFWPSL